MKHSPCGYPQISRFADAKQLPILWTFPLSRSVCYTFKNVFFKQSYFNRRKPFKRWSGQSLRALSQTLVFRPDIWLLPAPGCRADPALTCRGSHHTGIITVCVCSLAGYVPRRAAVVAGDRRVLQKVQLHVVVELLRRARVEGLREVLHLRHEVIHVLLHGGEVQREALRGVAPVRPVGGRRWRATRLRIAATAEPTCAKSPRRHQRQQQHRRNHSDRCHRIPSSKLLLPPTS